jgi:pyruvate/2-oxoacid:ferredoxin oxidoreductase beta subunit
LNLGATFVAQSFSGDKHQLVPLIQAAISHPGFALINVLSPCVTFNNNVGSTKSYDYVREHMEADEKSRDLHDMICTIKKPLNSLTEKELCPGNAALESINQDHR